MFPYIWSGAPYIWGGAPLNGGTGLTFQGLLEKDAQTRDLPQEVIEMLDVNRDEEPTLKRSPNETVIVDK